MKRWITSGIILLTTILVLILLVLPTWKAIKPAWFGREQAKQEIKRVVETQSENTVFNVHEDFQLSIIEKDFVNPRVMIEDKNGALLISEPSISRISVYSEGERQTLLDNLDRPHGLALKGNQLYVAETGQVLVYDYDADQKNVSNKRILLDLPAGGRHWTRTLGIGPDQNLYISVGSSCNICIESDWRRLKILRYDFTSQELQVYASGLRNAVFFTWHPITNDFFATEMGRDWLGDDLPPDELVKIQEGGNYGFPYCYGKNIVDPEYNREDQCDGAIPSYYDFIAHEAPLGIDFLGDDLVVALHGSWNRVIPVGYEVIILSAESNFQERNSLLSGFLQEDGTALGRPAGVLVHSDESIYISDDKADVIYKLTHRQW